MACFLLLFVLSQASVSTCHVISLSSTVSDHIDLMFLLLSKVSTIWMPVYYYCVIITVSQCKWYSIVISLWTVSRHVWNGHWRNSLKPLQWKIRSWSGNRHRVTGKQASFCFFFFVYFFWEEKVVARQSWCACLWPLHLRLTTPVYIMICELVSCLGSSQRFVAGLVELSVLYCCLEQSPNSLSCTCTSPKDL